MHNSQLLTPSTTLVPLKQGDNSDVPSEAKNTTRGSNFQFSIFNFQLSRVLVAPLNWGLGHATRCVPIIRGLLAEGYEVVIAADGYPLKFLRQEFPHLEWIEFEGLKVRYADGESQVGAMLRQVPSFLRGIWREHKELKRIVEAYDIDVVVSDNRFGLWCRDVHSVYVTHQLMVKMPRGLKWMEWAVWRLHRWFIKYYDECWVPDVAGEDNLSGDLSHKYPLLKNTRFIGPLSRFSTTPIRWEDVRVDAEALGLKERYDVVAVISGPEPHRSNLELEIASMHNSQPTVLSNSEKFIIHNCHFSPRLKTIGSALTLNFIAKGSKTFGSQFSILNFIAKGSKTFGSQFSIPSSQFSILNS